MEIKNKLMIYLGIGIVVVFFLSMFIRFKKSDKYKGGKKSTGLEYAKDDPYFKRKLVLYRVLSFIMIVSCLAGIMSSFIMLSKPYISEETEREIYSRDIILCIDISMSVDELNKNLMGDLKKMVNQMKGERFGIIIFNTSPVLVTPITDDYEYVIEQLDLIEKALAYRLRETDISDSSFLDTTSDTFYLNSFITNGTLVGAEERGSSLIGDGLAGCISKFDANDKDRTKIVIFTTDNELSDDGKPYFTLQEAALACKEENITVYGIGTKLMYNNLRDEMKAAVESTGGSFFMEEESGTIGGIVNEIDKQSKSKIISGKEYREIPIVEVPFILVLISVSSMIIFVKLTKR